MGREPAQPASRLVHPQCSPWVFPNPRCATRWGVLSGGEGDGGGSVGLQNTALLSAQDTARPMDVCVSFASIAKFKPRFNLYPMRDWSQRASSLLAELDHATRSVGPQRLTRVPSLHSGFVPFLLLATPQDGLHKLPACPES